MSLQLALYALTPFYVLTIAAHYAASRAIRRDMALTAIPVIAPAL
jgi:hypothetical protein